MPVQLGRTRKCIVQWCPGALAGLAESVSANMRDLHLLPLGVSPDRRSRVSLYHQIYEGLRSAILDGRLESGMRLPSTRAAAAELGIARNTVVAVFEQLAAEGFLRSRVGDGTRVADIEPELLFRPARRISRQSGSALEPGTGSTAPSALSARGRAIVGVGRGAPGPPQGAFQPGLPDLQAFPHRAWARILARHARTPERERLGYGDAAGDLRLRTTIAAYVAATRGVQCTPERVVVVSGAQAALDLCARLLLDPGDPAWIEEPGYAGARAALLGAGARVEPVPVDAEGLDVAVGETRCPHARLAYITPSCQFPLGATLSLERRLLLLDWAERAGAFVIEDDYDSEYRYRGRPLAAVQGIDANGRVAYIGTFSKTMFPALRVGYVIAPQGLETAFAHAVRNTGQTVPQPVQGALAEFIDAGHYARHVRRMRALYAKRQTLLFALVREHLSGVLELVPSEAGMQVAGWFVENLDDRAVATAGAGAGLALAPLSGYWIDSGGRAGLHLGYAGISEPVLEEAVRRLARVIRGR